MENRPGRVTDSEVVGIASERREKKGLGDECLGLRVEGKDQIQGDDRSG